MNFSSFKLLAQWTNARAPLAKKYLIIFHFFAFLRAHICRARVDMSEEAQRVKSKIDEWRTARNKSCNMYMFVVVFSAIFSLFSYIFDQVHGR